MKFESHNKICRDLYNNYTVTENFTHALLKTYSKAITKRRIKQDNKLEIGKNAIQKIPGNIFKEQKEGFDKTSEINIIKMNEARAELRKELRTQKGNHKLITIENSDHKSNSRLAADVVRTLMTKDPLEVLEGKPNMAKMNAQDKEKFFNENFFENQVPNKDSVVQINFSENFYIDKEETKNAVLALKTGKATDSFNISNEFLLIKSNAMYKVLSKILTDMLLTKGNIDKEMKCIRLVAIPKSDGSFRPICINSCLKGLLDSIILYRINRWISENKIVSERQIGFMESHNILDHVFLVKELVKRSNNHAILNFIDLKKAYNNIERSLLYEKLTTYYNIPKDLLGLIKISIEENYIIINGEERVIKKGLPQGNKISPILFNLFVNDLVNHLEIFKECIYLFADDITLLTYEETTANNVLQLLHEYCEMNYLTINTNKSVTLPCKILDGGTFINGVKLKEVDKFKFLGIILNKKGIDTQANLSECRKIIYFKAFYLRKYIKENNITNMGIINNLTKMFIIANVNFFWFLGLENDLSIIKLETIKKKAFKIIFGLPQRFSSKILNSLTRTEEFSILIKRCAYNMMSRILELKGSMINKWIVAKGKEIKSKKRLKTFSKKGEELENKCKILNGLMEEVFGMVVYDKAPFKEGLSKVAYRLLEKEIKRLKDIEKVVGEN